MGLLAITYPQLSPEDMEWIQSIRGRYDPHYELVAPHFTLVFEASEIDCEEFISYIRGVCRNTPKFKFRIRCAMVVYSVVKAWYLFLVPDEGYSNIVKLHDSLYTGIFSDQLRLDIPYIPHITIGRFRDGKACKAVADNINSEGFEISGKIVEVSIESLEKENIETVDTVLLTD